MSETTRTPLFSRYEVFDRLGAGGWGVVYRARHKLMGRRIALKVLPPDFRQDTESLERFKREAAALARLDHPHIARIYDADVEQNVPYLAMELIDGEDLHKTLAARQRLSVADTIRLGTEMADALDHVHRAGLVHRDVKPSNIIIRSTGEAVLTDFGIAFAASLPRITREMPGTPEYMSPEQVEGRTVDGRSDVYSLGVVLYECLTGTVPFQRKGDSLTGLNALVQQILSGEALTLHTLRPEVPVWLAEVVGRCLAKKPEDRFPYSRALAEALHQGATPEPPEPSERPQEQAAAVPDAIPPLLPRARPFRWKAWLFGLLAVGIVASAAVQATRWLTPFFAGTASILQGEDPAPADSTTETTSAPALPVSDPTLRAGATGAPDLFTRQPSTAPENPADEKGSPPVKSTERQPVKQRSLEALLNEGRAAYARGRYGEALSFFQKAGARGAPEAYYYLGLTYDADAGLPEADANALAWYRRAAEQGHAGAQHALGVRYRHGRGVPTRDEEAVAWFEKAATQGHAEAQANLAWMYEQGRGTIPSDKEAAAWYEQAARQGHVTAQYNLGVMYQAGRGVERSSTDAAAWYLHAAQQGHPNAQFALGRMYFRGEGVEQSDAEALRWYRKAAEQGHKRAQGALERMSEAHE